MKSEIRAVVLSGAILFGAASSANAGAIFFNDETAFLNATSSTSLIDFEGIVADDGSVSADPTIVGGVAFDQIGGGSTTICGANAAFCSGRPFDSAILGPNGGLALDIDFSGVGPITAAGGIFGNAVDIFFNAEISLFGAGNVLLDSQIVNVGDMGAGAPKTFFGWIATGGDVITRIEYNAPGANGFETVDNIRFGIAEVPTPATTALFGLGLAALWFARRKKTV